MKPKLSLTRLSPMLHKQRVLWQRKLSHLWENKDLKHVGFLTCHYVGFAGYICFTLFACLTLGLLLFQLDLIRKSLFNSGPFAKKDEEETYIPDAIPSMFPLHNFWHWVMKGFLWLLLAIFRLFAGFMGWGAKNTTPGSVIVIMLKSIPNHFTPNVRTALWSIPTLAVPICLALSILLTPTGKI